MCTKYQRQSIGLCCTYYICCFYNLCPIHCENKWIKLDPIKNDQKINALGFVSLNVKENNEVEMTEIALNVVLPAEYKVVHTLGAKCRKEQVISSDDMGYIPLGKIVTVEQIWTSL